MLLLSGAGGDCLQEAGEIGVIYQVRCPVIASFRRRSQKELYAIRPAVGSRSGLEVRVEFRAFLVWRIFSVLVQSLIGLGPAIKSLEP